MRPALWIGPLLLGALCGCEGEPQAPPASVAEAPASSQAPSPVRSPWPEEPLAGDRWKRRVLLTFAKDPQDPRLADLRARIEATQADFDDRRPLLVLVAGELARAEGREASQAAGRRLRQELGGEGDFELLLIGLDGGVKARRAEPEALDDFYRQIDGMPMRQAELRERGE